LKLCEDYLKGVKPKQLCKKYNLEINRVYKVLHRFKEFVNEKLSSRLQFDPRNIGDEDAKAIASHFTATMVATVNTDTDDNQLFNKDCV
jgi:hypothetical protein